MAEKPGAVNGDRAERWGVGDASEAAPPPSPEDRLPECLGISSHKRTDHSSNREIGIKFYPHGVQTSVPNRVIPAKNKQKPAKRGVIDKFSAKSRYRLREVLLTRSGPEGWFTGSGTFTVPGPNLEVSEFQAVLHHISHKIQKAGLCMVWRVEMQQRGMPHIHAAIWGPTALSVRRVSELWFEVIENLTLSEDWLQETKKGKTFLWEKGRKRSAIVGFDVRGSMVEVGESAQAFDQGWWRYLCDHTSKSKQAQLGWKGRQWGIVGRVLMRENGSFSRKLTEFQYFLFLRHLRRLTRSNKWRGSRGKSVWFSNPLTVARLAAWAIAERPEGEYNPL